MLPQPLEILDDETQAYVVNGYDNRRTEEAFTWWNSLPDERGEEIFDVWAKRY